MTSNPLSELKADAPAPAVVLLLFLAVFFFMLLGQGIILLWVTLNGLDPASFMETLSASGLTKDRNLLRSVALINQLFTFLLPALALGFFLYQQGLAKRLLIHRAPSLTWLTLGGLWILFSFPLAQVIYQWNQALPLPEWLMQVEESTNNLIENFLRMESPGELILTLVTMALAPAIGEELIFRGFLQRKLGEILPQGRGHLAIWLAALIFSAFHFQFQGFFPRMFLGAILGYLFFFSQNLWVPIFGHFVYNGFQVVVAFVNFDQFTKLEAQADDPISWPLLLGATVAFGGILVLLWRLRQTPQLIHSSEERSVSAAPPMWEEETKP